MSNEIHVDYPSGNTVFIMRRNQAGQVALSNGSAFENFGASGHDEDDYAVTLTDKSGDRYVGDFDANENIDAGQYTVQAFLQLGSNPSDGKTLIGSGIMNWGPKHKEIEPVKILANKAIQNKTSRVVVYYDDDGETPLLTQTPTNSDTEITRTPS